MHVASIVVRARSRGMRADPCPSYRVELSLSFLSRDDPFSALYCSYRPLSGVHCLCGAVRGVAAGMVAIMSDQSPVCLHVYSGSLASSPYAFQIPHADLASPLAFLQRALSRAKGGVASVSHSLGKP